MLERSSDPTLRARLARPRRARGPGRARARAARAVSRRPRDGRPCRADAVPRMRSRRRMTHLSVVCVLHDSAAVVLPALLRLARGAPPRGAQLIAVDAGSRRRRRRAGPRRGRRGRSRSAPTPASAPRTTPASSAPAVPSPPCSTPTASSLDAGLGAARARRRRRGRPVGRRGSSTPRARRAVGASAARDARRARRPPLVHPPLLPRPLRLRAEPWRADAAARSVGWAVAACLVARTATLRRLGPFDPGAVPVL